MPLWKYAVKTAAVCFETKIHPSPFIQLSILGKLPDIEYLRFKYHDNLILDDLVNYLELATDKTPLPACKTHYSMLSVHTRLEYEATQKELRELQSTFTTKFESVTNYKRHYQQTPGNDATVVGRLAACALIWNFWGEKILLQNNPSHKLFDFATLTATEDTKQTTEKFIQLIGNEFPDNHQDFKSSFETTLQLETALFTEFSERLPKELLLNFETQPRRHLVPKDESSKTISRPVSLSLS